MKIRPALKAIHAVIAVLLIVTAGLQWNDPDPLYWMVTYVAAAVVAGAACVGRALVKLSLIAMGLSLAGLLITLPGTLDFIAAGDYGSISGGMSDDKPWIESAREFGGLLVAFVYLLLFQVLRPRR